MNGPRDVLPRLLVAALLLAAAACGGGDGPGDPGPGGADAADLGPSDPGGANGDLGADPGRDTTPPADAADETATLPDLGTDPGPEAGDDPGVEPGDALPEPVPDVPADGVADIPPEVVGAPPVVVNEVVAAAPNGGPDWVEILNAGPATVDLSGWMLKDDDDAHIFTFPLGTKIAAGEFLVIEGPGGVPPLATLFGLGKGDSARLFDPAGTIVDETTWIDGQAPLANSWGRYPDGTGPFGTLLQPTRGAPNVAP